MEITKDGLKEFMMSLSDSIDNENIEFYKRVTESSGIKECDTPEKFYLAVLYQWDKVISGYLNSLPDTNKDVAFIYKHSRYLDNHFRGLYERIEGFTCCADKSRTVINRLVKFYRTGVRIEFDSNEEYTYHHPKTILNNHDDIVMFYEGLKSLLYGNPDKYLLAVKQILASAECNPKEQP